MRIIAGKYRRRKLRTNPGLVTRPITDRAKEQLFEYLQRELAGRRVADVFAGTGSLGLEALSRGAASAVFIETDRRAFELLEANVAAFGVDEPTLCWRADVFRCSFKPKGREELLPYDVVFFDPPYRLIQRLTPESALYHALERLARPDVTSDDALLLLRTPERAEFTCPSIWRHDHTLTVATMEIHWYRKTAQPVRSA
jgi:16S rRNA (guanine966-N2)-methyltransferase